MTADTTFLAHGESRYVALTTFRRDGRPVTTPVWVARDGDALLVTTPAGSGKVKRLRNDDAVTIQPCSRFGKVKDGTAPARGRATVLPAADHDRLAPVIRRKYPIEYRVFMLVERIASRGKREQRLILRLRPD
jgi:uncharacterized protein